MARIVIIGAGFAGQTAALYLGSALGRKHEITLINASDQFYFIPSFVWVGTGRMDPDKTCFPLEPVCRRFGIRLLHGMARALNPEERFVLSEPSGGGELQRSDYDWLLIATGPNLNFAGTPGLGPKSGWTQSICTLPHALEAREHYLEAVARMVRGERQRFVIGTGHPGATCQGAAFEYIANIHKDLVARGLRHRAELRWLSNEAEEGDFGIRGIRGRASSETFIQAVFKEFGVESQVRSGVTAVEDGVIHWQDYDGRDGETAFDFSMLIPQFLGQRLDCHDGAGTDIGERVFNPTGFVKVDAVYGLPFEQLEQRPEAWPAVYQNPTYANIFAAGIAFAPPGPISRPHLNPKGLSISAAPPRTGMIAGIIGRLCALNIIDLVQTGRMSHSERMSEMAAACIASMGDRLWDGSAATILIHPVVPDPTRYPGSEGRDPFVTHMEMGLAGAWMKRLIHSTFMHKLQGRPGWRLIPE
jgi:sulfide:quinone oxidoreductase